MNKLLEITRNLHCKGIFLYKTENIPEEMGEALKDLTFMTLKLEQKRKKIFNLVFDALFVEIRQNIENKSVLNALLDLLFILASNQTQYFNLKMCHPIRFEWADYKTLSVVTDTICTSILSIIRESCDFCIYFDYQEEKIRNIKKKIEKIEKELMKKP